MTEKYCGNNISAAIFSDNRKVLEENFGLLGTVDV
jgi:hypothetical protein